MEKESESLEKIKDNFIKIGNLLQETENLLHTAGFNPPTTFPTFLDKEKIKFPIGYIRTTHNFKTRYRLSEYIEKPELKSSICYGLQGLDVFSYFINRFNISLSAGKIFLKLGMVNVFSIIEGLLYGAAMTLHSHCLFANVELCKKNSNCPYYIKSMNSYKFESLIDAFVDKEILHTKPEGRRLISDFKKIRDKIHLKLVDENELSSDLYSIHNYNSMVLFLVYLKDNLAMNIESFKKKRAIFCLKK